MKASTLFKILCVAVIVSLVMGSSLVIVQIYEDSSKGYVGIGTSSPQAKLHVNGKLSIENDVIEIRNSGDKQAYTSYRNSNGIGV